MKRAVFTAALVAALAGCAVAPQTVSRLVQARAQFEPVGNKPSLSTAKELAGAEIFRWRRMLKDPDALKVEHSDEVRPLGSEWSYTFRLNGKNGFGAYTGYKTCGILIRNDQTVGTFGFSRLIYSQLSGDRIHWKPGAEARYAAKQ